MAEILQHGDYTVSGNDPKSSQKMALRCYTDLLSQPRQFLPAASIATHEDLIGSSFAETRVGTQMASVPSRRFFSRHFGSGRKGGEARLRWTAGLALVRSPRWPP